MPRVYGNGFYCRRDECNSLSFTTIVFKAQATAFFALDRRNSLAFLPLLRLTTLPYKLFSGIVFSDTIYQRQKPDRSRAFVVIPQNLCSPLLLPQKIARKGRQVTSASDNVAAWTVHKNATVCKKRLLRRRAPSSEAFSSLVFPLCGFCLLRPPYAFQRAVKFLFRNRLHQPVRRLFGVCHGNFLFGYSVYHAHTPHVLIVEG